MFLIIWCFQENLKMGRHTLAKGVGRREGKVRRCQVRHAANGLRDNLEFVPVL